ncbi:MAG: FMN-binding protein [Desulfosarcinaceae bacterium]|jgi:electron transport complex protein RnfG
MDAQATTAASGGFRENNIVQAWLVLCLAICFGAMLAGIQLALGPTIEQNKVNETMAKVPELVLGQEMAAKLAAENQALEIKPRTITVAVGGRQQSFSVFEARYQGRRRGWVVKTAGQGYSDKVELLLGLDPTFTKITGLFILEQKETPGLGNKMIFPEWRGQFIGKPTAPPLKVVKTGAQAKNEIDAITGATISSRSVVSIVNGAVQALREPLAKADGA